MGICHYKIMHCYTLLKVGFPVYVTLGYVHFFFWGGGENLSSAIGLEFVSLDRNQEMCSILNKKIILIVFQHMIKYRYIPFTHGKARYKGKEDSGAVVSS